MKKKNKKNNSGMVFFAALQKKVLIPSMYFANYSKSKNLSVGMFCNDAAYNMLKHLYLPTPLAICLD